MRMPVMCNLETYLMRQRTSHTMFSGAGNFHSRLMHGRGGQVQVAIRLPSSRFCIKPPFKTIVRASRGEYDWDRDERQAGPAQREMMRPRPGSYDYGPAPRSTRRTPGFPPVDPPDGSQRPPGDDGDGGGSISNITKAFVAGAFILGMGAGIWFDSEVTFEPTNVASTVLVDTKTPNSEVCMANGYSSMVFDQRIFVSFNPFNVYVAQPEVKPGCVLRRANFNVLESRGLVDGQQVQACKRNMNTFAFVGDLEGRPQVSCVYHSEEAENQFLRNRPKDGSIRKDKLGNPESEPAILPPIDSGTIEVGSR